MAIIEIPPILKNKDYYNVLLHRNPELDILVDKINDEYEYWDTVKYKQCPEGVSPRDLWAHVKVSRSSNAITVWKKYNIHLSVTSHMQKMCHTFDMDFGGSVESESTIPQNNKELYLISSLMEEAISSSQMEGAATTRKIAKEMLKKKITPKDKSQQMIYNNYQTIQYLIRHKNDALSSRFLLAVHRLMTENTMENPDDSGRYRLNDDVVVEDGISHSIVHTPPSYTEIPQFIDELCSFFNAKDCNPFIHPVIRGIIIHFMIAYVHPFVDGNGRTARALFYWYMLKEGYWLTEYLSISRVISRAKKSYEKSFLYVESDGNDIGYFVTYNLRVLDLAYKQLQQYISRKMAESKMANTFLKLGNINSRQAEILKIFYDNPKEMLTVKDVQTKFLITPTTAKTDLKNLMNLGFIEEVALNKVKNGYIKGQMFDDKVKAVSL